MNDSGKNKARKLIRKHRLPEVLEAMQIAVDQYLVRGPDGAPTEESVGEAFRKVRGVLAVRAASKESPWLRDVLYIRGILNNRLYYVNPVEAKKLLEETFRMGGSAERMKEIASTERNWTNWREAMWEYQEELQADE